MLVLPGDGLLPSFLVLSLTPHSQPESPAQPTHEGSVVNTDLSVAPEIAQLADPFVPAQHVTAVPRTDGRIAAALTELAATPQRWWDLVRFDAGGPVRIPVPGAPAPGCSCCLQARPSTATASRPPRWPARRPRRTRRPASDGHRARPGQARCAPAASGCTAPAPAPPACRRPGYSVTLHCGASRSRSE